MCNNFTIHESNCGEVPRILRVCLGALAVLTCCVALVVLLCFKAYKQFLQRLVLYLTLGTTLYCLTSVLQVAAKLQHFAECAAVGYLITYSGWMKVTLMCSITLHFFLLAMFQKSLKKYEWVITLLAFLLPAVVAAVPLSTNTYGHPKAWCWICPTEKGFAQQVALWYVPFAILMSLNYIAMGMILSSVCLQDKHTPISNRHRQTIKDSLPLLFYPMVLQVICFIGLANRISHYTSKHPSCVLVSLGAAVSPLMGIVIIVTFLTYICRLKRRNQAREEDRASAELQDSREVREGGSAPTEFPVSPECSTEGEPLIIRGSNPCTRRTDTQRYQIWCF